MALQNYYVNPAYTTAGLVQNPPGPLNQFRGGAGAEYCVLYETWTIANGDNSGSIYRIFRALDPNIIPVRLWLAFQANAGVTNFNVGLYFTNSAAGFGAIVGSGNQFLSAATMAAAKTSVSNVTNAMDALAALPQFTRQQRLFEIAGETETAPTIATTRRDAFDLCLTTAAASTATNQIECLFEFVAA